MLRTIHFDGTITADEPLTSTPPSLTASDAKYPNRIPRTKKNGATHLKLFASGWRGALRRAAETLAWVYEQKKLGNNDIPFKLNERFYNLVGGIKPKGKETQYSPDWYVTTRQKNLIISLFGASDPFMTGRASISGLVSTEPVEPEVYDGIRTVDFVRNPDKLQELSKEDQETLYAMLGGQSQQSELKKKLEKLENELKKSKGDLEKEAELSSKISDIKDSLGVVQEVTGGVPLQAIYGGYEAIPEDTQLTNRISIFQATDNELGFFLAILDAFSYYPYLGGKRNHRCGQVSGQFVVSESSLGNPKKELGVIKFDAFEGLAIVKEGKEMPLSKALKGWEKACEEEVFEFKKQA